MRSKYLLLSIIFGISFNLNASYSLIAANMIMDDNQRFIKAYYTQGDTMGWDTELKGKIIEKGADLKIDRTVTDNAQDSTNASARLYNNIGVSIGDILYIINSNNLIVGKITVSSVFKTDTFGYMAVGTGKLRLVNIGDRVVQRINNNRMNNAFVYRGRGDINRELGETGKAINFYKNALMIDKNNPEAHLSLGYIYLNDDMLEYANTEFREAEKNVRRMYDNEDRYYLFKGLTEVRFKQSYFVNSAARLREKYIKEGIEYSKRALNIYPDSKEVNYYLGIFYYRNAEPEEVLAKDQLLKAILLDENNADAYIALAELYDKHDNREKAITFAEKALKIDPANDRAKNIIKKLK